MGNLLLILLLIFGGVALIAVITERFAKPQDAEGMGKLQRWWWPVMLLLLVAYLFDYMR